MDRPFSIVFKEFKDNLADLINNSNIPACVIELILQNYLFEISNVSRKQYEHDKSAYVSELNNSQE